MIKKFCECFICSPSRDRCFNESLRQARAEATARVAGNGLRAIGQAILAAKVIMDLQFMSMRSWHMFMIENDHGSTDRAGYLM